MIQQNFSSNSDIEIKLKNSLEKFKDIEFFFKLPQTNKVCIKNTKTEDYYLIEYSFYPDLGYFIFNTLDAIKIKENPNKFLLEEKKIQFLEYLNVLELKKFFNENLKEIFDPRPQIKKNAINNIKKIFKELNNINLTSKDISVLNEEILNESLNFKTKDSFKRNFQENTPLFKKFKNKILKFEKNFKKLKDSFILFDESGEIKRSIYLDPIFLLEKYANKYKLRKKILNENKEIFNSFFLKLKRISERNGFVISEILDNNFDFIENFKNLNSLKERIIKNLSVNSVLKRKKQNKKTDLINLHKEINSFFESFENENFNKLNEIKKIDLNKINLLTKKERAYLECACQELNARANFDDNKGESVNSQLSRKFKFKILKYNMNIYSKDDLRVLLKELGAVLRDGIANLSPEDYSFVNNLYNKVNYMYYSNLIDDEEINNIINSFNEKFGKPLKDLNNKSSSLSFYKSDEEKIKIPSDSETKERANKNIKKIEEITKKIEDEHEENDNKKISQQKSVGYLTSDSRFNNLILSSNSSGLN